MEKKIYSGIWWISDEPKIKKSGELICDEDGELYLKINGSFLEEKCTDVMQRIIQSFSELSGDCPHEEYILINGTTISGEEITLYQCQSHGNSMINADFLSQVFKVEFAFIGKEIKAIEELLFNKIEIQYSHLEEWVDVKSCANLYESDMAGKRQCTFSYEILEAKAENIISEGDSIKITFDKSAIFNLGNINVAQFPLLEYKAIVPKNIETLFSEVIRPIQNLLTFATDLPNDICFIKVYSSISEEEKPIKVMRNFVVEKIPSQGKHSRVDCLFYLKDIKEKFGDVLTKWFAISVELQTECSLFLAIKSFNEMHLRHQFLNIVQTLESYHRLKINNCYLEKDEFRKRIKKIKELVKENCSEYSEWIDPKISNNEPSLKERLLSIVNKVEEFIPISDRELFVKEIRDVRNSLTHVTKGKEITSQKLYDVTCVLILAFQIILLQDLGLNKQDIQTILENYRQYMFLIRKCEKYQWI